MDNKNNYAYVACINNERYVPGLYAVARSLSDFHAKYPLIVLVPDGAKDLAKKLVNLGYSVRTLPNVSPPDTGQDWYWNQTFFKLSAASLTCYKKIVLLDADLLILENIDSLFQYPHLSAAMTGRVSYPWLRSFNSGVLVLEPSKEYYEHLLGLISSTVKRCREKGQYVGDQDVFQASCPDWYQKKELHLHERFNESPGQCILDYYKAYPDEPIAIVHYAGPKKPWDYSPIHYLGVKFIKYWLKKNFKGARYLRIYFRMTRKNNNQFRNPFVTNFQHDLI